MVIRGADAALVSLEVRHEGEAIPITASFGVSQIRPTDVDLDEAVNRADAAMYMAKQLGRNRVETDP